jgi:hypothetical protein
MAAARTAQAAKPAVASSLDPKSRAASMMIAAAVYKQNDRDSLRPVSSPRVNSCAWRAAFNG